METALINGEVTHAFSDRKYIKNMSKEAEEISRHTQELLITTWGVYHPEVDKYNILVGKRVLRYMMIVGCSK